MKTAITVIATLALTAILTPLAIQGFIYAIAFLGQYA